MLKCRILKTTNKKVFKQLNIGINKIYSLKDIDYLLNLLTEEIVVKSNKKETDNSIFIKIELIDSETKNTRWYTEKYKIDEYSQFINSNDLNSSLSIENSLLRKIVERDLNQDPEVNDKDKEEIFNEFENSYYGDLDGGETSHNTKDRESKTKKFIEKIAFKSSKFNKNNDKRIDVSETTPSTENNNELNKTIDRLANQPFTNSNSFEFEQENINFPDVTQDNDIEDVNKTPTFEDYDDLKNDFHKDVTAEIDEKDKNINLKEGISNSKDNKSINNHFPIILPTLDKREIVQKNSDNPLNQLKYEFLFTRNLEREQIKETLHQELVDKINNKYKIFQNNLERKIIELKTESEYTNEEIENIEQVKREELNKKLEEFITNERVKINSKLKNYREELEQQFKTKENDLNIELENNIQDLVTKHEKIVEEYLIEKLNTQDQLIQLDIEEFKENFNIETKDFLNKYLNDLQEDMNNKLAQFDKVSFARLNQKISDYKQEILTKELRYNQKVKLENEKLKLELSIKDAKKVENELEKQKEVTKLEEINLNKEIERKRILELEVEKDKQVYQDKLLKETQRKNDLKQKEIELNKQKLEEHNRITQVDKLTDEEKKDRKNRIIFSTLLSVIILILCSFLAFKLNDYYLDQKSKVNQQAQVIKSSLTELIDKREYEKALKEYPYSLNEIEKKAFKSKDINGLDKIINKSDDKKAILYKALLEKNSKKIVKMYPEVKKEITLDDDDYETIALSMIDEGKIQDAETINKEIKSTKLTEKIKDYKLLQSMKSTDNKSN
ncbi:hypothetical protein K4S71_09785 [Staphylococcus epidermidis]|nr:hypothetical protein [Staphylococcus epidermidis]MCG1591653.1 hypothetical protein [Staphylococcus epidermidis]MCG2478644.1 hypothetical protein [Staphylococcus epidermidis]